MSGSSQGRSLDVHRLSLDLFSNWQPPSRGILRVLGLSHCLVHAMSPACTTFIKSNFDIDINIDIFILGGNIVTQ